MMVDVSVIINLHNEGRLCEATLESVLRAARHAEALDLCSEIIYIVDNGDEETLRSVSRYDDFVSIHQCHFGDLSQSRNYGVSVSAGKFVTFIDGDDLWGKEWISRCMKMALARPNDKLIIHPQINLYFGKGTPSTFWVHPDMHSDQISLLDIFIANRWTALSFAKRSIFEDFPYTRNQVNLGFGYEDWLWHIQTTLNGYEHASALKTCHFIRRKTNGSLLARTNANKSVPDLSTIDDSNNLRQSLVELLLLEERNDRRSTHY